MHAYTIIIFIALVFIGGLAAWMGDVIGYKLGKSRSSLWGLRPRVTARLIGSMVGALLPIVGLLVATALTPMARTALFELSELTRKQQELAAANQALSARAATLKHQVGTLRTLARQAEDRSEVLQASVDNLSRESVSLKRDVANLTNTRDTLKAKVTQLETRYHNAEAELKRARKQLKTASAELETANGELELARAKVSTLQFKNTELEDRQAQLQNTVDLLSPQVTTLEARVNTLTNDAKTARAELEETQLKVTKAQEALEAAQRGLEAVEALADIRKDAVEYWKTQYELYRKQHMGIAESPEIYEAGDVVLPRFLLRADQTSDQLNSELLEILFAASRAAESKGAVLGENGRSVLLVAPWVPDVAGGEPTEKDIINYLATQMKQHGDVDQWVISIVAFRRLVVAEHGQLHIAMWARPNVRVFVEDQVIAETTIEAGATPASIFSRLWILLKRDVRKNARDAGLLADPETDQYGAVDAAALFDIIEQIQKANRDLRVQVVAATDTYTADELRIQFVLHRQEPQQPNAN